MSLREQIASKIFDTYGQEDRGRSLRIADAVMAVRDEELEALRAELDGLKAAIEVGDVSRFAVDVVQLVNDYSDPDQSIIARLPFLATFDQVCFEKYGINIDKATAQDTDL